MKETISFSTISRRIKYLGINHLRRQKTCPLETVRCWWKKSKMTQTDGKIYQCTWIGRINTVKVKLLPKAIYKFNVIPIKLPKAFFTHTHTNPKIYMERQKTPNSQNNLKKTELGGMKIPAFRLYYTAIVIKTLWYWYKDRLIDHCNRIESPEITPCIYG